MKLDKVLDFTENKIKKNTKWQIGHLLGNKEFGGPNGLENYFIISSQLNANFDGDDQSYYKSMRFYEKGLNRLISNTSNYYRPKTKHFFIRSINKNVINYNKIENSKTRLQQFNRANYLHVVKAVGKFALDGKGTLVYEVEPQYSSIDTRNLATGVILRYYREFKGKKYTICLGSPHEEIKQGITEVYLANDLS